MKRIVFLFCFFSALSVAYADIGETFEMLRKREQILLENEQLLNGRNIDSLNQKENSRYIENLHIVKLIDQDIFKSQKETVDRLSGTSGSEQYINKSIALFSFLLAVALALSLYMVYIMNIKLNRFTDEKKTFSDRVKELFAALLVNFKPGKEGRKEVNVNRLIILGMLFMFISFVGYLLQTLGV